MKTSGIAEPCPEEGLTPGWWVGPFPVLLLAVWFGLAAGFVELTLLVVRVRIVEHGGSLRSKHFYWMVPLSNLFLFVACGLVIGRAARVWPRRAPRAVVAAFVFLACLSQLLLIRGLSALACMLLAGGVARVTTPVLLSRWPLIQRVVNRSVPSLLGLLAVLAGQGLSQEAFARRRASEDRPPAPPGAPNVLLIVLDTVRADHLSLYGYDRETTPYLHRLAREGVRFDVARSTAPWTLPSHASMFTGRWPHELAIERHGNFGTEFPTLAEFLRDRGYATAGVVANQFFCGHSSGLARGFDVYRDDSVTPGDILCSSTLGWLLARNAKRARDELNAQLAADPWAGFSVDFQRKDAAQVNREFLDWLSNVADRPFFAFLNYFDAHDPYMVPQEFRRHLGKFPHSRAEAVLLRDWWKVAKGSPTPDDVELARDAYDDCIASLDQGLSVLFEELTRRGLLERTVVIITADHGEQFGEHGHFRHGTSLYEPEIHVPLVIVAPNRLPAGRVVREPVSLRDIPATIVDLLGWRGESPFPGSSLARTWASPGPLGRVMVDATLAELGPLIEPTREQPNAPDWPSHSAALFDGRFAYIGHKDGDEELYDLDTDPTESRNLCKSAGSGPTLAAFRRNLAALLQSPPPGRTTFVPSPTGQDQTNTIGQHWPARSLLP
jgi:arylsulfatase A-like enzyme